MGNDNTDNQIPIYSRGTWTTGPHPVEYAEGDYDELKSAAGFDEFTGIGLADARSLTLKIWRHLPLFTDGRPSFLLEIETSGYWDTVGAGDIADVMDLLAKWAPAVQAAAITDLLEDAKFDIGLGPDDSTFAAIGALVAEGADRRQKWTADLRAEAAKRRTAAQARKAQREAGGNQ